MHPRAAYRDPSVSIEARVADLLGRMTREEKVAQLGSVWAFEIVGPAGLRADRLAPLLGRGLGHVTRLAGSTDLGAREVVIRHNEIQRYLIEETRLGIPAIVHEECLHGLMAAHAPCFQQSIGAAATWDPELVGAVAGTIRRRMVLTGARQGLAPVLDITRDPRWGRIEETYGEDPYLAAAMGIAYIRDLQGTERASGVIATGKHLVGHGLAEGGLNQAPAHVGPRELREEQLLPFEAAIVEGGLASIMPAYGDVDGIACHGHGQLLGSVLRGEWGFEGTVVSDYSGIEMLADLHHLTPDPAVAAAMAIRAGVDVELPQSAAYAEPLLRALADGTIDEALVDGSVVRVLREKFRLGLFERPEIEGASEVALAALGEEEARVGLQLALSSVVLLENDGVLPLRPDLRRVAVVGPLADSGRDLAGDYSHQVHLEALNEMRARGDLGIPSGDAVTVADAAARRTSILAALHDRLGRYRVVHAAGGSIRDANDSEIADAVAAARRADVAVAVLGERSGLTLDSTTGESRDRRDIGFMGRQQELLEAVVATGTPVVLVVLSGRPLALEWASGRCAAVLMAWVPGDAGAAAIAHLLLGDVSPGGKLPVTVPRHVGQVPISYRHHPSGGRSNWNGDYVDGPVAPLWPFGHGRSYTTFALSDLRLDRDELATDDGEVDIRVDVTNTGARTGDEVVQLYVRDEEANVARPVLELKGFRRVTLAAGERRTVRFTLAAEQLCYVDERLHRIVEPGRVSLWVGTSAAERPLAASIRLVGPTIELPSRRRFLTPSVIE